MSLNPRKAAADIIYKVCKKSGNLSEEVEKYRFKKEFSDLDVRFLSELASGTMRKLQFIDYVISKASNIKLNKISPFILAVLETGTYQILFMDRIPESAAVNECVKLVKNSGNKHLSGFVNAVLRKVSKNGVDIDLPLENNLRLSVKYSFPLWITERWITLFENDIEKLLCAMNEKPCTILRTNTLKTTTDELIKNLNGIGWICERYNSTTFKNTDSLIKASKIDNLTDNIFFKSGMFYVQDSAAAYVANVLAPNKNDVVIDMCAAPGGKTTHISELMKNTGKVYAFDIYDKKIDKINENAKRLGITNIVAKIHDATVYMPEFEEKADKILVDAPCTGLGIIRRKPDIKYLRHEEDIQLLSKLSRQILDNAAKYLKKGGKMVFSTCTLNREENEDVLFDFLKGHSEFKLKKIDCTIENDGYITLFPHKDDCDGFFISLLEKE